MIYIIVNNLKYSIYSYQIPVVPAAPLTFDG